MRRLPFGKFLEARRLARRDPWLVELSVGGLGPKAGPRVFGADREVSFVRVPDDVDLAQADWRFFVGLDVLIVPHEVARRRIEAVAEALWRARVATVRLLVGERLPRLQADPAGRMDAGSLVCSFAPELGAGCRAHVQADRALAKMLGEPPLFSDAAFDAERAALLDACPG